VNDDVGTAVHAGDGETCYFAGYTVKESGTQTFPASEYSYCSKHNGGVDGFIALIDKVKYVKQTWYTTADQGLTFATFLGVKVMII